MKTKAWVLLLALTALGLFALKRSMRSTRSSAPLRSDVTVATTADEPQRQATELELTESPRDATASEAESVLELGEEETGAPSASRKNAEHEDDFHEILTVLRATDVNVVRDSLRIETILAHSKAVADVELKLNVAQFLEATQAKAPSDGPYSDQYPDGTTKETGRYERGRKVGLWTTWHANGKRASEGHYVYGARHGSWTEWHANGALSSAGDYVYDRREGHWSEYHANGKDARSATFVNDKVDGRVVTWFENGQKESDGVYCFGELHQSWRAWHPNGKLAQRGTHDFGKRVGRWEARDEEGDLDAEESGFYENGERVRE